MWVAASGNATWMFMAILIELGASIRKSPPPTPGTLLSSITLPT
jgi:hypothetical protein